MLDTDTSSLIVNYKSAAVLARLQSVGINDVCISVITKCELLYGVEKSPERLKHQTNLDRYLAHITVLDFSGDAALHYAQIRAGLRQGGNMIGANDLFLAAHARALGMTIVTNKPREFNRVPNLKVENWSENIT
jgi:tRNA(fMet)-specific endonuclease VapC